MQDQKKVMKNKQYYKINIDMFYSKTYKSEPNINEYPPKYVFPVYFHYKGLDFIHINKILRNEEVKSKLPNVLQNDETPSVAYIMSSTNHNKLDH